MTLIRIPALLKRAVLAAAMGWLALCPAEAQTISLPTPPITNTVDPNGIDLQTGFVSLHEEGVSIGDPAHGGLSHSRDYVVQLTSNRMTGQGNGGWRHSFLITVGGDGNGGLLFSGGSLSLGGAWTYANGIYSSPNGETFTYSGNASQYVTLTLRDGTIILFDNTLMQNNASYSAPSAYLPVSITKPNGEIITFTYKRSSYQKVQYGNTATYYVVRLQSVENNYGYMLKYSYISDDPSSPNNWLTISMVSAINLAAAYCAPDADSCPVSAPAVTYASTTLTDSSGANYSAMITTLPSGRTITYK